MKAISTLSKCPSHYTRWSLSTVRVCLIQPNTLNVPQDPFCQGILLMPRNLVNANTILQISRTSIMNNAEIYFIKCIYVCVYVCIYVYIILYNIIFMILYL